MRSRHWLLAGLLLAGTVHAVPNYGPGMGPGPFPPGGVIAPEQPGPALALRAGMDKLLAYLAAEPRPSQADLAAFLEAEIAPFFDFEYMAQSAGGRLFEQMDANGKRGMVEEIKTSFLSKMVEKLGAYDQQQVRFMPPRGNDGRTAQFSVAVLNPGSYPARLDFRMYRNGDRWLVYDVAANGNSAIVHYRNQMLREARRRHMLEMQRMVPMGRPGPGPGPMGMGIGPRL